VICTKLALLNYERNAIVPTIKLYDFPVSGNCYKIRLLLSMMKVNYQSIQVNLGGGANQTNDFLAMNPRGQVPVIVDGETTVWDSMAILAYLAREYGDEKWFPQDNVKMAEVMQWLAVSENELLYGIARSRAALIFKRPFDLKQCQEEGQIGLEVMDKHLSDKSWLVGDNVTIADIACYPYVSLASEGEISLDRFKNVLRWVKDFEALPGWISIT
jgi:glutathione S-transferase